MAVGQVVHCESSVKGLEERFFSWVVYLFSNNINLGGAIIPFVATEYSVLFLNIGDVFGLAKEFKDIVCGP